MFKVLFSFIFIFIFSCASIERANIEIPKDIQDETVVTQDATKGTQKEIKVTQHVIETEEKQVTEVVPVENKINGDKKTKTKTKTKQKTETVTKVVTQDVAKQVIKVIKNPFKVGEKIKIDLSYIGIKAATLDMEIMPFVTVNGKKAYNFKGVAQTTSLMKYIYRVYDVINTYVDYEHFVPLKMSLTMDESKQNVSMVLVYNHQKGTSTFWKKRIDDKKQETETRRVDPFTPYAQDIFSALYFVRTYDLKVGDKVKFVVHDNGKNWSMTISAVKTEKIWTRLGSVDTLLLVPTVEREGEKYTKGKLSLWITNDARKIPVKFEAEVRIGSMKGLIQDYIAPKN